jgi:hypothetical protein
LSTIVHLLLAVVLTLFVALQATSLAFVLRCRRAGAASRPPGRTDLLWSSIPIVVVLFLAARSWLAVLEFEQPVLASTVTHLERDGGTRGAGPR